MTIPVVPARAFAIVLGCGDIGSAVALWLHAAGYSVVLADEADPSWHRRGMAFTNAWYIGTAELENECACFCASLKSIPSVIARRMIAATTWSWRSVAAALEPVVLVDARGSKRSGPELLRGGIPFTIGIGPGYAEGDNVDVAIALPSTETQILSGGDALIRGANADGGVASCNTVEAHRRGRFVTERRIGEMVRAGQAVGGIGSEVVAAPVGGVLLGLAARGARIEPADTLVEVDPDGLAHRCHGVSARSRRLAENVMSALAAHPGRSHARTLSADVATGVLVTSKGPAAGRPVSTADRPR